MKSVLLLVFVMFLYSCPTDDEQPNLDYSCCRQNPFELTNVDNLDQSQGEITIEPYFTPNNDGINDFWVVRNLYLYSNGTLEIFNANDQLVFSSTDF